MYYHHDGRAILLPPVMVRSTSGDRHFRQSTTITVDPHDPYIITVRVVAFVGHNAADVGHNAADVAFVASVGHDTAVDTSRGN